MPDVYSITTDLEPEVVEVLATAMETSAADLQHQAMVAAYLAELGPRLDSRVVEIGCGTGAITRTIAVWPGIGEVVGTDPSSILIERARRLSSDLSNVSFQEADGGALPVEESSFDVAVLHRVLSHTPAPDELLTEARRVLRAGGRLVVFDGDYATITLATGDHDPLQVCVSAMVSDFVNDPWVVRPLPRMIEAAGFTDTRAHSYGFIQTHDADYMVGIADRGADALAAHGRFSTDLAQALKAEARHRVANGSFFGHIAYASFLARTPD